MLCCLAEQNIDGLDVIELLTEEEVGPLTNNVLGDKKKLIKAIQSLKLSEASNQIKNNIDVCIS